MMFTDQLHHLQFTLKFQEQQLIIARCSMSGWHIERLTRLLEMNSKNHLDAYKTRLGIKIQQMGETITLSGNLLTIIDALDNSLTLTEQCKCDLIKAVAEYSMQTDIRLTPPERRRSFQEQIKSQLKNPPSKKVDLFFWPPRRGLKLSHVNFLS